MDKVIHKLPAYAICLTFVLMPILAIAGGLGIAPMGFLLGLAGWAVLLRQGSAGMLLKQSWVWVLAALLIWCIAAQIWSPYKPSGLASNANKLLIITSSYCGIAAAFNGSPQQSRQVFRHLFMASSMLAVGLIFIEVFSGYKLSFWADPLKDGEILHYRRFDSEKNLGRGILTYAQFLPAFFLLFASQIKYGIWLSTAMVLMLCVSALQNELLLPPIVIVLTGCVMALAWWLPKLTVKLVLGSLIGLILLGPVTGILTSFVSDEAMLSLPLSLEHRFRMWAYSWELILQHPFIGHGFDASRSFQDTFRARDIADIVIISLHPHNASIQIWLELGAVGALLAALLAACLIKPALHFAQSPIKSSALCGTITACALFGMSTIGAWQFWWIGSIFIALAALTLFPDRSARS